MQRNDTDSKTDTCRSFPDKVKGQWRSWHVESISRWKNFSLKKNLLYNCFQNDLFIRNTVHPFLKLPFQIQRKFCLNVPVKFLLVFIKINFFPTKLICGITENGENTPFLFSTKPLLQFLIWSTESEYILQQLTEHKICWLRVMLSTPATTNTRTFLFVAAMDEIFSAAITMMAIISSRSNCLYSRLVGPEFIMFISEK